MKYNFRDSNWFNDEGKRNRICNNIIKVITDEIGDEGYSVSALHCILNICAKHIDNNKIVFADKK